MKKTGSIRVEIVKQSKKWVQMRIHDDFRRRGIYVEVTPENVTDIREEVDWSKVKKNTPIAVWNRGCRQSDAAMVFFRGVSGTFKYGGVTSRGEITIKNFYDNAMLLEDWLKEHGNKEDGDE